MTISSWCSFAKHNLGSTGRELMFLHFMKYHKAGHSHTVLASDHLHFFLVYMS